MNRHCSVCSQTIRRGDFKVLCSVCQLKAHAKCLGRCSLYSQLLSQAANTLPSPDPKNETSVIECFRCKAGGQASKKKQTCVILPSVSDTFFSPVRVVSRAPRRGEEELGKGEGQPVETGTLGKRQLTGLRGPGDCSPRLHNHEINDYISVKCLIELRKHRSDIATANSEACYLIPSETVNFFSHLNCVCGENCLFTCGSCDSGKQTHEECVQQLQENPSLTLLCHRCYNKTHKPKKKKCEINDEIDHEEPSKKQEEPQQRTIRYRKAPITLLQTIDRSLKIVGSKRLDLKLLEDPSLLAPDNTGKQSAPKINEYSSEESPVLAEKVDSNERTPNPSSFPNGCKSHQTIDDHSTRNPYSASQTNSMAIEFCENSLTKDLSLTRLHAPAASEQKKLVDGRTCYPLYRQNRRLIVFDDSEPSKSPSDEIMMPGVAEKPDKFDRELDHHIYPTCINRLRDFAYFGYYTRYTDFLLAFDNLFKTRYEAAALDTDKKLLMSSMYSLFMSSLLNDKNISKFNTEMLKDAEETVNYWRTWKIPCSAYPRIPRCSRQYEEIKEYVPAVRAPHPDPRPQETRRLRSHKNQKKDAQRTRRPLQRELRVQPPDPPAR